MRRARRRWALGAGLGLGLWLSLGVAAGQESSTRHPDHPAVPGPEARLGRDDLLSDLDDERLSPDCYNAEAFGGTLTERRAFCLLGDDDRRISMRRLAERALREDPRSYRAHFLMGYVQHVGETNLPRALYFLERAEALLTERYGRYPARREFDGLTAYRLTLLELVYVHGEMDHHEEKIRWVDELKLRLDFDYTPLKAWPLMKLGRFDEAQRISEEALELGAGDSTWESMALTALCAVHSEARRRQEAYEACRRAAESPLERGVGGAVALSNAAAAAIEMFRFDEAERFYLESTRRMVEPTINPWGRLAHLYLQQGRFAEAVSALKEMRDYRLARPPYFDQQDQADAELTVASVLMVAGHMEDALRITARVAGRPDRQGTSSAAAEQNEAGNLLMDRLVKLDAARRREAEAGWSPLREALKLRAEALKLRFDAWMAGRRAASLLAAPERLHTSLRPECPGSVELPSWLDGEVVQVVGAGVAWAGIQAARREETLPAHLSEPVFRAFEAEAHFLAGRYAEARDAAAFATENLAPVESLRRARVAAFGAAAAERARDLAAARGFYEAALGQDPGVFRRLGLTIPVKLEADQRSAATEKAKGWLSDSPFFREARHGFTLSVAESFVALRLQDGSELFRAPVRPGKGETAEQIARRIVKTAHFDLLVPEIDITQADIRSLDGGLTGGGRASERTKNLLEEILGPSAPR